MTLLQLKQEISKLSAKDRVELNAYMIRLRHESKPWSKALSKRMADMDKGKKLSRSAVSRQLAGK
jgi:hypothetical protein